MIYYLLAVIKTRSVHLVSLTATSAIKHKNHTRYMTDVSSRTDSTLLDCTKIHMSQFGTQNLYAIYMKSFQGWLPTCEYTKLFTQFTLHTMSLPTEYIIASYITLRPPDFTKVTINSKLCIHNYMHFATAFNPAAVWWLSAPRNTSRHMPHSWMRLLLGMHHSVFTNSEILS